MFFQSRSVAGMSLPPLAAVAAIERASMSATAASWPWPGFEPSRLGKLRVVCLSESEPCAGVSAAPKHGPQNAVWTMAPRLISFSVAPLLIRAEATGTLAG